MADELTAGRIMTEGVIAIESDASVQEAAQRMREEGIRSLVVVNNDEAIGILVGRDVVYKVVSEGRDPTAVSVDEVMTEDIVTAGEHDEVDEIARAMIEHDISRVPILRGDQLVGIVTQSNILQAWPSYIDLLREENQIFPFENNNSQSVETESGECDNCENYSEELVIVDGRYLCPDCRVDIG